MKKTYDEFGFLNEEKMKKVDEWYKEHLKPIKSKKRWVVVPKGRHIGKDWFYEFWKKNNPTQ